MPVPTQVDASTAAEKITTLDRTFHRLTTRLRYNGQWPVDRPQSEFLAYFGRLQWLLGQPSDRLGTRCRGRSAAAGDCKGILHRRIAPEPDVCLWSDLACR